MGPRLAERLPIEEPEEEADDDEGDLIERPGDRQQTEGDESSQRFWDAAVAGENLHGTDEASRRRDHRPQV